MKSVGFADIDKQIVANEKSVYRIGSIGNAKEIRIGYLLGHRSGIYNFTANEQYPNWQNRRKTKEQMVEIIASCKS
ncbi:MAG: hypothetical protein LBS04_05875 [Tannerellaceae bacterium]|nr:hypothetical protein [Tannerellaceae bacterium]